MEFNAINGVILIEEICQFPIALLIVILVIYITGFLVTKNIGTKKETSWLDIIKLISLLFIMGSTLYELLYDPLHLKAPTGEYKVITIQDVSMTEFQDTYEITNYKDGVYTVRMKGEQ